MHFFPEAVHLHPVPHPHVASDSPIVIELGRCEIAKDEDFGLGISTQLRIRGGGVGGIAIGAMVVDDVTGAAL